MQKVYQLYENYCNIREILHMTLNFATNIKINIFKELDSIAITNRAMAAKHLKVMMHIRHAKK